MGKRDVLFRLYVAARLPNSQRALANLTEFCRQHLADRHRIEVVDVFESPERALADNVLLTPTLVVVAPLPTRTIVGDLSDAGVLLQVLHREIDQNEAPRDFVLQP